jgi:hypothetical protein
MKNKIIILTLLIVPLFAYSQKNEALELKNGTLINFSKIKVTERGRYFELPVYEYTFLIQNENEEKIVASRLDYKIDTRGKIIIMKTI